MPERTSAIPAWAWIVGAVLAIVSIFAVYRMVRHNSTWQQPKASLKAQSKRRKRQTLSETSYRTNWVSHIRGQITRSRLAKTQPLLEAAQSALESAKKARRRRTPSALNSDQIEARPHRRSNQSNPSLGDAVWSPSSAKRT